MNRNQAKRQRECREQRWDDAEKGYSAGDDDKDMPRHKKTLKGMFKDKKKKESKGNTNGSGTGGSE